MLEHGGRLRAAAQHYGITPERWLDLSTGINPIGWPVPTLPPHIWSRLPEDDDGLETAARDYYGAVSLLPVAGSQAAIQTLPRRRAPCRVAVLEPGYAEHAHAWRQAGHLVTTVSPTSVNDAVTHSDVLVLINPNNPTGERFGVDQLLGWHAQLAPRDGWLIVDEAFMDATPERSLAPHSPRPGLFVLRSLGKFFGLAGARMGFVLAEPAPLNALRAMLGPWAVPGPSRWVATQALNDRAWQVQTRALLARQSQRLATLLAQHGLAPAGGSPLFQWVRTGDAACLHKRLAQSGILTRLFTEPASLRFGLPGSENSWQRLEQTLREAVAA